MQRPFYATVVMDGPFEIRKQNYTIKSEKREAPVVGSQITGVGAEFGEYAYSASRVLNEGLSNRDDDCLLEHSTSDDSMYIMNREQLTGGFVFTLPAAQPVESVAIWNYNKPGYTDQGIAAMDVSIWTEKDGWQSVLKKAALQEAEGSDDYDEPTILTFKKPVTAQKIRFKNLTPFDTDSKQIGLSAVQFYEPIGPAACEPQPQNASTASCSDTFILSWKPGKDAIAHDVYVGETEQSLTRLGRVKGLPQVTVSGLAANKTYTWRIDEVTAAGKVTAGPVWSFTTRGSLVGHWPLDGSADDAAAGRNGTLVGEPTWKDGHFGKALAFDGQNDTVQIPAMNLNTDAITICAWIKPDPQTAQIPGIVFCRADNTVAGINLLGDRLRYHWADSDKTWGWDSGFRVPFDGVWMFTALTVQPHKGMLYFALEDADLQSSENLLSHPVEPFDGPLYLGRDPAEGRYFKGLIDDVRIFDFALSPTQIDQVRRNKTVNIATGETIQLVNADLVEEGQSLKEVAAEQQQTPNEEPQKTNILPVIIIIAIVLVIAVAAAAKSKK